jgi:tripartite-type tricarboxylate transporter receptor subunit TctC
MKKFTTVLLVLLISVSFVFAQGGREVDASKFPTKTVETTVQWSAGGGADMAFRAFAEVFPKYANGRNMVIKNVPGASGVPGSAEFKENASKDGYSLMHWSNAHVSNLHMNVVPYDNDSFRHVAQIVENTHYVLVRADSPWTSLDDFLADAKRRPQSISMGNGGSGGGNHLAALLLEEATGTSFVHVPFQGGAAALTGLLSGEVDAAMCNSPEGYANVEGNQLRMLVSFGAERLAKFPSVPTAKESGLDIELRQWRGFAVPVGTPEAIVERLDDIIRQVVSDPDFVARLDTIGAQAVYRNTEEYNAFVKSEDQRFMNLIKSKGFGNRY